MAGVCITALRGRRFRFTKVNPLGRPIYGPASTVTTGGVVTLTMTPEIAEGTEIEVTDAAGEICLSERSCDQLRWITVQAEFCKVDIQLWTMINDTFTALRDCDGEVTGVAESYRLSCDTGFALEIWTDVANYTPSDPRAPGAWLYYLIPFLVGGQLGEETIENGAVTFTITARTKKGSGWGIGPYSDVMCNDAATRACGPLLVPVGPDEPRRRQVVTCPPPAASCGAVPLNDPALPLPVVVEDTSDATRMTVRAAPPAGATGTYRINWGDGSPEADLPAAGASHQYTRARDYVVEIWPTATPANRTWTRVQLPYTGTTPIQPMTLTVTEDTTVPSRQAVRAVVNNQGQGAVTINWGDGSATTAHPGDGTTVVTHAYTATGQQTVTATDTDDASRTATQQVTIPFGPLMPVVTLTQSTSDTRKMTVSATVDNHGLGAVTVDWGDGTPAATNPGDGTTASTHKYTEDATYNVVVTDTDNSAITATRQATVPFDGGLTMTVSAAETSPAGPDRRSVTLTWDNQDQGPVTVDWGDGTADGSGPSAGTLDHVYAAAGTFTVTVTDATTSTRSQTTQVTVPFTG